MASATPSTCARSRLLPRTEDAHDFNLCLATLRTAVGYRPVDQAVVPTRKRTFPYTLHVLAHVAYERQRHQALSRTGHRAHDAFSLHQAILRDVRVDPLQIVYRRTGPDQRH